MAPDAFPAGGNISDMAATGTSIPEDSAKPRIIPSKPRSDQVVAGDNDAAADPATHGAADLAAAADGAVDTPRNTKDAGATTEVLTGTGDQLPAQVGEKHLHNVQQGDLSKGHPRSDKHVRQEGSALASKEDREASVVDGVVGGA